MTNNISVSNDYLSHVAFNDEAWKLHTATQHARDSLRVNVFRAISSNKILPYYRISNYRHSHHDVMEVRMMSHFRKDNSITFFFKQNGPVSQFLSVWLNFST